MSQAHPTTEPEQVQTDTFAVFRSIPSKPNMELIGYVEVPRFSQPNSDGVRLDREKRLSLAVARAVERTDTFIESPQHAVVGEEFAVSPEMGEMEYVEYEQNPAFDAVWNPESEGDE